MGVNYGCSGGSRISSNMYVIFGSNLQVQQSLATGSAVEQVLYSCLGQLYTCIIP
uniref:Uncharacterized protein n=1 Tax=Oryza brachyantha TaxID=4533 RepID=J3L008_ORYBR